MPPQPDSTPFMAGRLRLGAFFFALGWFAQIAQVLVFRETLANCTGSELIFGAILAGWLGWGSLGSMVGAYVGPRVRASQRPVVFVLGLAGLSLALSLPQLRYLPHWLACPQTSAGQLAPLGRAFLLALAMPAPSALLCGMLLAVGLKLVPAARAGRAYAIESLGAAAGGLAFSFLLVHVLSPARAYWLGAAVLVAAGWWLTVRPGGNLKALALLALPVTFAAVGMAEPDHVSPIRLEGFALADVRDGRHGRVTALHRTDGSQVALFHDASLAASLELETRADESVVLAYVLACLHENPRRALLIGGALTVMPAVLAGHVDVVEALEPDPTLLATAQDLKYIDIRVDFGNSQNPQGLLRRLADARRFLREAPDSLYDLIVIQPGETSSASANRLCTEEFFQQASRCLTPQGVLVVILPTYGATAEYVAPHLLRRAAYIAAAMPFSYRAAPLGGLALLGCKDDRRLDLSVEAMARRMEGRLKERPFLHPRMYVKVGDEIEETAVAPKDYFEVAFGGVLAGQEQLDGPPRQKAIEELEQALSDCMHRDMPANRDAHPLAIAEGLAMGWAVAGEEGSEPHTFADSLRRWGWWTLGTVTGLSALALLLALLGWLDARAARRAGRPPRARSRPRPHLSRVFAALAAGLFSMGLEVVVLWCYQNVRGYVYGEIGAIAAMFMGGLAVGAWAGGEFSRAAVPWLLGAMALLCVVFVPALEWSDGWGGLWSAGWCWGAVLLAGLLNGAIFPLIAAPPAPDWRADAGAAAPADAGPAGWIYAAELLGAGLGALLAGAIWIPLVGMETSLAVVAGVLLAAAGAWVVAAKA